MKLIIPKITIIIAITSIALFYLFPYQDLLYFNKDEILNGQIWRLVTGHFSHSDQAHLLWNILALAVLGIVVEQKKGSLVVQSMFGGIVLIDAFLLSPFSDLSLYCGMSGVLNALLVMALCIEWRKHNDPWLLLLTFACFMKIIVEIIWNDSLFTHISWPPYPYAHLVGFIAGLLSVIPVIRESYAIKNQMEFEWFY